MKNIIYLLLCLSLFTGCKKNNETPNGGKLRIIVTNVTTGNYTIALIKQGEDFSTWNVTYKTDNTTYETDVVKGDQYTVSTSLVGVCHIDFEYNGKRIGQTGNTTTGTNRTKIFLSIL